ncbi:MAG: hypothetical protein LBH60_05865 [Prevotellaceae bacterium]|jgi:hypothetical protein|nr:hypothetical protein [Prevotellaceae bacterium]
MAYNKNSGESRLQKGADRNAYIHKKNKNIFKGSQTAPPPPPKSQCKTSYEWDIPNVDIDLNIPVTSEFEQESRRKEQQKRKHNSSRYENDFHNSRDERQNKQEESQDRQESLSFKDIIFIVIINIVVPVAGGFIYYIAMSVKGSRQKAVQSIVLSAIVSIIRIMYLPANIVFFK